MFSLVDYIFENKNVGGVIARTATTVAVPIPGAGIVLAPVASIGGEIIGKEISMKNVPEAMKDSVEIYKNGGRENISFSPNEQIKVRTKYAKKAKSLGYNKLGQSIAAIDPGLLTITPNSISKN